MIFLVFAFPLFVFSETNYQFLLKKALNEENPYIALKYLEQAQKIEKQNPLAYWISANIYFSQRNFEKSSNYFLKTVLISKKEEEKYLYIQRINSLTSEFTDSKVAALSQKAKIYQQEKKYDQAIATLYEALKKDRFNISIYIDLAYNHEQVNQGDYSIFYLKKAEKINPISSKILGELKTLYLKSGQFQKALDYLNRITRIYSENAFLSYEKAIILLHLQKVEESQSLFQILSTKYPDFSPTFFRLAQFAYLNHQKSLFLQYYTLYYKNLSSKQYKKHLEHLFPLEKFDQKLQQWKKELEEKK